MNLHSYRPALLIAACAIALAACGENEDGTPRRTFKKAAPVAVSASVVPPPAAMTPVRYDCGGIPVRAVFVGETNVTLDISGSTHSLGKVNSTRGTLYESVAGVVPKLRFWNTGSEAKIDVEGKPYADCVLAAPEPAAGPEDFIGREWQVGDLDSTPPIAGRILSVTFGTDGKVSGDAGCNRFSGAYTYVGEVLEIGPLMSTKMACMESNLQEQEDTFLALLNGMSKVERGDGQVVLKDAVGRSVLLTAVP